MKKASDTLYRLIHALDKSEQRYFTLFAERHQIGENNNYWQLFQIIKKNKIGSDKELQPHIQGVDFVKHLPVVKHQLTDNLLKALSQYDEANSEEQQIKRQCHKAFILLEKDLPEMAEKYLNKAEKKALAQEHFHLMPEIIEIRKRIITKRYYKKTDADALVALCEAAEKYRHLQQNKDEYWLLRSRIYKLHSSKAVDRKVHEQEELTDLLNAPQLKDEQQTQSKDAQLDYLQLNALRYFIEKNYQQAFEYNRRFLRVFDEHPYLLLLYPGRYRAILNNYLIDCVQLDKEKEFRIGLERLYTLPQDKAFKKLKDTALQVFRLGYQLEMNWNITKGNFGANSELIPHLTSELKRYKKALAAQQILVFYYLITYSLFATGRFEECLDWANKIINETDEKMLAVIQVSARMLEILAHVELGNDEYALYAIERFRRFIRKQKSPYNMEKALLTGLTQLLNQTPDKHPKIYDKMLKNLSEIEESGYFKVKVWVQSKIQKCTYESAYD